MNAQAIVEQLEPKTERREIPFDPSVGDERYPFGSYALGNAISRAVERSRDRNAKQRISVVMTPLRRRRMFLIQDVR